MKGLTLLRPWPYAITHLGKRVENRTWQPHGAMIGQRIAVHAGKGLDEEGVRWILRRGLARTFPQEAKASSIIVATAIIKGFTRASSDAWFVGPVGWILDDVRILPQAINCRGAQGLWDVPDYAMQLMRAQNAI